MNLSKLKKLIFGFLLGIFGFGVTVYFFTLQAFQQIEITRMKMNGISSVVTSQFHYFEKNNCVDSQSCQCALLIHGLGDFALTWRKMMSAPKTSFSKNVHFYAINLPGALSTPKLATEADYNVQTLAQNISDYFLPQCESWVLVGNSYGAWISVFMALKSEKIKGLLLLGPAGIKKDYSPILNYFLNPTVPGARDFYQKLYAHPKDPPDFIFQRVVERAKTQPVLEELRSIHEEDYLDHHLKNLKIPVQYVWGEADRVIPTAWAPAFKDMTPGSELKILKNCGHVPQKECTEDVITEFSGLLKKAN